MRVVLLLSASLVIASCTGAQDPYASAGARSKLLQGMHEPPVNLPRAELKTATTPPVRPRTPPQNAAILWQGDRRFVGVFAGPAQIATSTNLVTITPQGAAPIEVIYDLPDAMEPIPPFSGVAQVVLREHGDFAAAERTLLIRTDKRIILGAAELSNAAPIHIDLGNGLTVEQSPTTQPEAAHPDKRSYSLAPLTLLDHGKRVAVLPVGKIANARTSSGEIQIFVELSHHYAPSEDSETSTPVYLLKAWFATTR